MQKRCVGRWDATTHWTPHRCPASTSPSRLHPYSCGKPVADRSDRKRTQYLLRSSDSLLARLQWRSTKRSAETPSRTRGRCIDNLLTVGRKRAGLVHRRGLIVIAQIPDRIHRKDKYSRLPVHPASERYFRSVRRDGGVRGDVVEPGDLALILAIGIHHPDFLMAGTVAGEIDMGAVEGLAAEQSNDVGGEFVRYLAGAGFIHRRQVALADQLGVGRRILAQVVEPTLQHQHAVL